jgi:hypothetical protein
MLAVAVVGLVLGTRAWLRWRSIDYRQMAATYARHEESARLIHDRGYLKTRAEQFRLEAEARRLEQAVAQRALDAKRAADQPTTQQERREPWYYGLRAAEAEWGRREALARLAFHQERVAYYSRMRQRFEQAALCPWITVASEPEPSAVFEPSTRPQPPEPPP